MALVPTDFVNRCPGGKRFRVHGDETIEVEGEGFPTVPEDDDFRPHLENTWRNWAPLFRQAAEEYGIPTSWLVAIAATETGLWANDPERQRTLTSSADAVGIMQVVPRWQPETREQLLDAETNIRVGARILAEGTRRKGSGPFLPHLASDYNAGPGHCWPGRNPWNLGGDYAGGKHYVTHAIRFNNAAVAMGVNRRRGPAWLAAGAGVALGAALALFVRTVR